MKKHLIDSNALVTIGLLAAVLGYSAIEGLTGTIIGSIGIAAIVASIIVKTIPQRPPSDHRKE